MFQPVSIPTVFVRLFSVLCLAGIYAGIPSSGLAQQSDDPLPEEFKGLNADQILELVRLSQALQNNDLSARLTKSRTTIPTGISMRKGSIYFKFKNPDEILQLQLGDKGATLSRETRAGKGPVAPADYGKPIRGTDVTLEDLSMRFLYWPKPVKLKDQIVRFKKCWVLRVVNPNRTGPYQTVRIWVHQASGALLQMEGFGWKPSSKPIKRFRVTRVQKVDKTWILREMVVETLDPKTGKRLGDTKLQVRSPKKVKR